MEPFRVDRDNFQKEVREECRPVLLEFWADWCGPCRMLSPTLESLFEEEQERLKVCRLDVVQDPDLATEFQVTNLPTLVLFRDGKEQERAIGVVSKEYLLHMAGLK